MMKIANAPCSWGALEFDLKGESPVYLQVLQEMKETGYQGTELGDWGFMPTEPAKLRVTLERFHLELLGAFVPVAFADPGAHRQGKELALKTAGLMHAAGYPDAFIVLSDDNGAVDQRKNNAGSITKEMGLSGEKWKTFAEGVQLAAKAVKDTYGMKSVFHHHCGGFVETPREVNMLMKLTDPELLGLCLDTGHYAFGGGDPVSALNEFNNRIWHMHFKDYDPSIGEKVRKEKKDYFQAVEAGVFCELGKGNVDFKNVLKVLEATGYDGWIVVEQDVLPGMGSPKACALHNREFIRSTGY
ncbi:MAG: TIM barrel protein [Bacteroidales bacterium]|nr:TIM barrel protein [Bacteroidales bacterium]